MTYWDTHDGARTPQFINWTFGVQRQLLRQMSLSVSYVGSQGHFISGSQPWYTRDNKLPESMAAMAGILPEPPCPARCSRCSQRRQLRPTSPWPPRMASPFPTPTTPLTPPITPATDVYQYYVGFPQFSGVSDTTSFVGNSNWNALEISLVQRHSYGLDLMVNYTYSKSIDDIGTFRVNDNPRLDRSLSTTDQPQNLAATVVYQSPFGKGGIGGDNFWVRSFAGGWALSSIVTYHSGYPVTFTGSGCGGSSILGTCMPFIVPGQSARTLSYASPPGGIVAATGFPNTFSSVPHLNSAAFTVDTNGASSGQSTGVGTGPAWYVPGNAPRVGALNVWGMGTYNIDLGIRRTFPIYESLALQFEADFLNTTNHVVWSSPGGAVNGGSAYGEITALSNLPRDVQLAARINW